jgi:glutamine synthetase
MEKKECRIPDAFGIYGDDVFSANVIERLLPKKVAVKLLATMRDSKPLDPSIADAVADAMKTWALSKGATHFTHWFQPLTGGTAEKHDSFIEVATHSGMVVGFSGRNLIGGEADASSFPSGGLRSTFEARGYTAWDPTSPAFIKRHANGATLCIPTVFCSYTGDALDSKTPLLRSVQAVSRATERLMKLFHQPKAHVSVTLGAEQEYFLIDHSYYMKRPDLLQTGRTVFGAAPAKHQQLEDHYYGAIRPRVLKFMQEVDEQLWRLGIPAKTRHNEVAPAQFELAPMFEDLNLAVDHNMMIMEVLRLTAERNGFACLLHEKPFEGVNGSGKHCNWSIAYGERNLLKPGKNPKDNAIFLTMLSAVIRAIDLHADMLRSATACAGNDHRLGANEAPPAIISIFLGDELSAIMKEIESGRPEKSSGRRTKLQIGVDTLPPLPMDTTDRNRTSPFAFTGNKFEFRTPGSSQNCSVNQMVLNTIVAESIDAICDKLEAMDGDFNVKLQALLQRLIRKHKRVLFSGDGYSDEWREEAAKRNLPELPDTPAAIVPLKDPANQNLFLEYGVLTPAEMNARMEIAMEDYRRRIGIEGAVALEIAQSMVRPVVAEEFSKLATAFSLAKKDGFSVGQKGLSALSLKLGAGLDDMHHKCDRLNKALAGGDTPSIISAMRSLRKTVDAMENLVADDRWPLPKYREMLFVY